MPQLSPVRHTPTKERILLAAAQAFSQNGFYGTSVNEIAEAVSIKKPSLLHHFASKEKLYGAVLERISNRLIESFDQVSDSGGDEKQLLIRFMDSFYRWTDEHPGEATLILREMLDNPKRAGSANNWYLAPFLDRLVGLLKSGQSNRLFKELDPLAFVYNIIGAQHYFVVSLPTLKQILSAQDYKALLKNQRLEIVELVRHRLFQ